jgi:hypothetical protein
MGTGTLFVLPPKGEESEGGRRQRRLASGKLRREKRALNSTETEESFVVQYLVLGGHRAYVTKGKERGAPWLAASGIHAGAGRQVFGWSEQQRCDLVLFFKADTDLEPSRIYYHNHHGDPWHYTGHFPGCPGSGINAAFGGRVTEKNHSRLADDFRKGLAQALSEVRPQSALFFYTVTNSCQMVHGMRVPGLRETLGSERGSRFAPEPPLYRSAKEALLAVTDPKLADAIWLPAGREFWEPEDLIRAIASGKATGFVTIRGGRESPATIADDPAGHRFGFCVQKYAPRWDEVSSFTKDQIAGYFGWHEPGPVENQGRDRRVREFLEKQTSRTLCASSFLVEETVSTTYLAWLMAARGYSGFEVTHFLQYSFRHWGADFLEPVLQRRHDCKRAGDLVAAECLKLIGNGSYGYNGLEASNYDDLRLMTDDRLQKGLGSSMAHLQLKHTTFLGVVRVPKPPSSARARRKKSRASRRSGAVSDFFSDQAAEGATDSDEDEDDPLPLRPEVVEEAEEDADDPPFPEFSSDSDGGNQSEEESWRYSHTQHRQLLNETTAKLLAVCRVGAESRETVSADGHRDNDLDDDDEDEAAEEGDLEEALVGRADAGALGERKKKRGYVYRFLYAVSVSGKRKAVLNSLPRAVAVLSNSKRLFLSHLDVMFRCLDPRQAELCYVDTDSCIWSLAHPRLDLCLRPDRRAEWERAAIVADEEGPKSCHGLMKLEGTYSSGLFKNIKMYRLFESPPADNSQEGEEAAAPGGDVYTRCKGVGRNTAARLNNDYFFQAVRPPKAVVHRSTLRPTRAGEIHLVREAKSLAVPFNLKRAVDESGLHSVCFSQSQ